MSNRTPPKQLSQEALDRLLIFLDDDGGQAAEKYRQLHRKLTSLFEWRGCSAPEELADETFNRVGRKLADGLEIRTDEPIRYLRGVAHNLIKEDRKRAARQYDAMEGYRYLQAREMDSEEDEERKSFLKTCLAALASPDRDMILRFYRGEKSSRIANRRNQAAELGISRTALRIRAHRLRKDLERCVKRCLNP